MLKLNEDNYYDIIMSYTASDWKPLLDLIPIIESHRRLAQDADEIIDGEVTGTFYYRVPIQVINRFRNVVNWMPIIIDFEWASREEVSDIIREDYFDFDFNTIDIPTKCIIISAIIDLDKIVDFDVLADKFQNGFILMLLKSIKEQLQFDETRPSAFAVLDILGYGKLMEKDPSIVVELINELLNSAQRNWMIQRDLDRFAQFSNSPNIFPQKIEYLHFSDTLLIWLSDEPGVPALFQDNIQLLLSVSYAASITVATFMSSGIPIRGAIGIGDAFFSKKPLFFTGKDLYNTIKDERKQYWAGAAFANSAVNIINPSDMEPFIVKYEIPIKKGEKTHLGFALNWVAPLTGSPELTPPWEQMSYNSEKDDIEKIKQAKKFFNFVASKQQYFPTYLAKETLLDIREKLKQLYI